MAELDEDDAMRSLARLAAQKILSKDREDLPVDPRSAAFASEYIKECDRRLASTPMLIQEAIESAGHAAEGANVDPYQGVVEVLQNAEDRRASSLRIMLRESPLGRQMLLVHDGWPIEYEHVLAMMLPFVSTKRDDADLRGRFGIGLKTLRRICTDIEVHGAPYHFGSGPGVGIVERPPENAIPDFYNPESDTLLVLHLERDFDPTAFGTWFDAWTDEGLIFLDHIRRFALWHKRGGFSLRSTKASAWEELPTVGHGLPRLERRMVTAGSRRYTVYRGHVEVAEGQERFHKRTGATSAISVATSGAGETAGIFVGLRTRIPTTMAFALDGQFDPTSSRESIQDNKWNAWLIGQAGIVLAHAASNELTRRPKSAWSLVPLNSEGTASESWPAQALAQAFETAREQFAECARVGPEGGRRLSEIAYEDVALAPLLSESDIAALAPDQLALPQEYRDRAGRWRLVLDMLGVSRRVSPADMIDGIGGGLFANKQSAWWVSTAVTLSAACEPEQLFSVPIWLREDGVLVASRAKGATDRKIVLGALLPPLSRQHSLFDVLHPDFAGPQARAAIGWLQQHAAFTHAVNAEDELLAFAENFERDPIRLRADEMRELRDLLDPLSEAAAAAIGKRLGAAVLIEAVEAETRGNRSWRRPSEVYLPKAIDKGTPYWPQAAWGVPGLWWAHPSYDEGLRTGLGKKRKREDGTRSRGARKFLTLLGALSGPRLQPGPYQREGSAARRDSMARAGATKLAADIRSPDLERVLRVITATKTPKKERKDRAVSLLRSLSREWGRRLEREATVPGEHTARVYTYSKGTHDALWLDRLKETTWIPVGRDRFRKPTEAAVRTSETQAIYKAEDLVAGVSGEELDEAFLSALGLTARVRASDLLAMLESMRDGKEAFDAARVYLTYQHFARLVPKSAWVSSIDDIPIGEFRQRFSANEGLVLVDHGDGTVDWRTPEQVRRGKKVIPNSALYVPDRENFRPLWNALRIVETTIGDCCEYLKVHADNHEPAKEQGTLIQVYRHLDALLLDSSAASSSACRHIPLACHETWRARRPIYLIPDAHLRDRLAATMPDHFFWQPPCDTRSIQHLVNALAITRIQPHVRPRPDTRAKEQGEDLSPVFRAAVDHLSNALGKRDANLRQALTVSWDALREAKLLAYDGEVPVEVDAEPLGRRIQTSVQAHVEREPLAFHLSAEAIELREGAGAAIASLFESTTVYSFDGEWVLAWQEALAGKADPLQFAIDDAAHKAKMAAALDDIASKKGKGPVKLTPRNNSKKSGSGPPPPPPRELKEFQPGILTVEVVNGASAQKKKPPIKPKLGKRPRPSGKRGEQQVANTNYTNADLEDFGWDVLVHVLERSDSPELEDFRRRHGVGADGAFDWGEFVELKATGRSMQSSVSFTPMEFKRALERGNDYILVLVYQCESGSNTRVKLIFDPVRRVSLRETEGVRLNGLPQAVGLVVELGADGVICQVDSAKADLADELDPKS